MTCGGKTWTKLTWDYLANFQKSLSKVHQNLLKVMQSIALDNNKDIHVNRGAIKILLLKLQGNFIDNVIGKYAGFGNIGWGWG